MIFLADTAYPELINELKKKNKLTLIHDTENLYHGIRNHPDIHIHPTKDTLYISHEVSPQLHGLGLDLMIIENTLGTRYPDTVLLNAITTDTHLIANAHYICPELLNYAESHNKKIVHCSQGYLRCTTLPITTNSFITDDPGVADKLSSYGLNVLTISNSTILLQGFAHGFFGGTCGIVDDTLYFNGDLNRLPDADAVRLLSYENNLKIFSVPSRPLTDIGGIIYYNDKGLDGY